MDQEGWEPEWTTKYTEYSDGTIRINSVKLTGFVKTRHRSPQQTQNGPFGFQDGIPTADELRALFGESFKKGFYDPLRANIDRGGYTSRDIINYVQNFNYADLKPTKGNFGLAPVQGSRFAVTDPTGVIVSDFDLFPDNPPNYFGYIGKVTNPGVGLIEVTTPSGYLIQFVVNLEFRLNF
ncbi:MAG: hypothetical protein DYG99_16565 [Bacteroidetes bacterium CHB5]|nr:hypothetical protein [Bacteroidetes bacterium CHB5]